MIFQACLTDGHTDTISNGSVPTVSNTTAVNILRSSIEEKIIYYNIVLLRIWVVIVNFCNIFKTDY